MSFLYTYRVTVRLGVSVRIIVNRMDSDKFMVRVRWYMSVNSPVIFPVMVRVSNVVSSVYKQ